VRNDIFLLRKPARVTLEIIQPVAHANKLAVVATVSSTITQPASGYEYWDGTSMATTHVSAVAALVWSAKSTVTNAQSPPL